MIAVGAIVLVGGVWAAGTLLDDDDGAPRGVAPAGQTPIATDTGGGTPQPPGPAPAGKVWSPEHGHWHDAPPQQTGGPVPAPPGPAPAGKVWSPEHGHWHDAPPGMATGDTTGGLEIPEIGGAPESAGEADTGDAPANGGAPASGSTDGGS